MTYATQEVHRTIARCVGILLIIKYISLVDIKVADLFVGLLLVVLANEFGLRIASRKIKDLQYFIKNLSSTLVTVAANQSGWPLGAKVLKDLATTFPSIGERDEAETLYRHALAICRTYLGEAHPEYIELLEHYRSFRKARGKVWRRAWWRFVFRRARSGKRDRGRKKGHC